ncbi:beta-1,6-N-acetylglucosaminyltransferase [Cronbergia sp. UHCC 0137]|uniref:beta-1,6-N-acetylglucosaminyltransferase n=1 Tax=Cronbergia sp. UHCC 0137 TaxID=3110239 RepID=UPI002B20BF2B|nr:beta-1,6-N-acetylglucosaminyltransferase [Cronbergia sp. UHCC 0137]MEA5619607.1 beta-1,6-N-acetylglucosaminyltransferase [Cronbergia sp. UHCC 0137]
MFNYPPIVCHHDFSKSDLSVDTLPKNVSFVRPHLQTAWGEFSLVEATVQAIKLLYESENPPDWFILLSGTDYPIKTAKQILTDLSLSQYDAHIHHQEIIYKVYQENVKMSVMWQMLAYRRYCSWNLFSLPFFKDFTIRWGHPLLSKPSPPFSQKLRCFAGSQWFSANHRTAKYIIKFHSQKNSLTSHYRRRMFADESYFQTILANAPHLNLKNDDYRYVDWSTKGAHPKTLVMEDLPSLLASPCHFARKFDIDVDSNILDQLDTMTLP